MHDKDNSENGDALLSKKITRKQFVEMSALGIIGVAGAYFLKDLPFSSKKKANSYGNERYGGC
jgi:hypothetical protein